MLLSTAALLHRKPICKRNLQQFETLVMSIKHGKLNKRGNINCT